MQRFDNPGRVGRPSPRPSSVGALGLGGLQLKNPETPQSNGNGISDAERRALYAAHARTATVDGIRALTSAMADPRVPDKERLFIIKKLVEGSHDQLIEAHSAEPIGALPAEAALKSRRAIGAQSLNQPNRELTDTYHRFLESVVDAAFYTLKRQPLTSDGRQFLDTARDFLTSQSSPVVARSAAHRMTGLPPEEAGYALWFLGNPGSQAKEALEAAKKCLLMKDAPSIVQTYREFRPVGDELRPSSPVARAALELLSSREPQPFHTPVVVGKIFSVHSQDPELRRGLCQLLVSGNLLSEDCYQAIQKHFERHSSLQHEGDSLEPLLEAALGRPRFKEAYRKFLATFSSDGLDRYAARLNAAISAWGCSERAVPLLGQIAKSNDERHRPLALLVLSRLYRGPEAESRPGVKEAFTFLQSALRGAVESPKIRGISTHALFFAVKQVREENLGLIAEALRHEPYETILHVGKKLGAAIRKGALSIEAGTRLLEFGLQPAETPRHHRLLALSIVGTRGVLSKNPDWVKKLEGYSMALRSSAIPVETYHGIETAQARAENALRAFKLGTL